MEKEQLIGSKGEILIVGPKSMDMGELERRIEQRLYSVIRHDNLECAKEEIDKRGNEKPFNHYFIDPLIRRHKWPSSCEEGLYFELHYHIVKNTIPNGRPHSELSNFYLIVYPSAKMSNRDFGEEYKKYMQWIQESIKKKKIKTFKWGYILGKGLTELLGPRIIEDDAASPDNPVANDPIEMEHPSSLDIFYENSVIMSGPEDESDPSDQWEVI